MISAVKIQMHPILFDTNHNTTLKVLENVYRVFVESSIRCEQYLQSVVGLQRAAPALLWGAWFPWMIGSLPFAGVGPDELAMRLFYVSFC